MHIFGKQTFPRISPHLSSADVQRKLSTKSNNFTVTSHRWSNAIKDDHAKFDGAKVFRFPRNVFCFFFRVV
jgi:hypothetical protein